MPHGIIQRHIQKGKHMEYRVNKKTGDRISEIGIGSSYMYQAGKKEAIKALRRAYEGGINYYDLAAGHGSTFAIYGEAFHDVRENIFYQIHFGADYTNGDYGWCLDLARVKRSVAKMLAELQTDYIDYGFIHCQDEDSDWEIYKANGIYDYLLDLKKQGIVRHIGLSSHTPSVIMRVMDEADIDMLMFSINPAYEYGEGEYAFGEVDERKEVYQRCEKEGIGISVMKPFSGGQLLDASRSPFGKALSIYQCLKYALDRPGVLVALAGAQSVAEIESLLKYYEQPEDALDYSLVARLAPSNARGKCVYCGHCKPCPMGIDIGLVNKCYDLALAGDCQALEHYKALQVNASNCIGCGHCNDRCPFGVKQSERMQEIAAYML